MEARSRSAYVILKVSKDHLFIVDVFILNQFERGAMFLLVHA